ncbi:hypothetical protein BDZ94DRAFT_1316377 [Collybia nuda]|uniref:Uncharacterized protein n=1 Tax=Collybia nuda TaxID=64659 RepID=A0A9P5XTT2_9AGAR|nr:hypothetical protein BDZ94DRAFT_1316377 [Collybia nuda]
MVRGWNDTDSRISVRFSDTAEQRELRRNERNAREGDNSPSRITIAQAALLNLHGQELRSQVAAVTQTRPPIPSLSLDRCLNRPQTEHARFSEYSSNAYLQTPAFSVDYSLAPGRRQASRSQTPTHTSPYLHHAPLPSDPRMQGTIINLLTTIL